MQIQNYELQLYKLLHHWVIKSKKHEFKIEILVIFSLTRKFRQLKKKIGLYFTRINDALLSKSDDPDSKSELRIVL